MSLLAGLDEDATLDLKIEEHMEVKQEDPGGPPVKRLKTETEVTLDIDDVLDKCLAVRKRQPVGQNVHLPPEQLEALCLEARDVFLKQPMLPMLEAPLKLCGDVHGQYHDLLRIFDHCGCPPQANYLFLGDYVDRGKKSVETVCLLFAYKVKYPENFFLLRGNHESPSICRIYGFYDECKRRYAQGQKVWHTFCDVFNCLPVCATVDDKVIGMHGGLSPEMLHKGVVENIERIPRPADIPDQGLLCDLLWSDPNAELMGFAPNDRGVSVAFGANIVGQFLQQEDMDLVVRAHQVVEDGYEFFAERRLVTIFSAPNYCGEFDNAAAVMTIDENLMCSFQVLRPALAP